MFVVRYGFRVVAAVGDLAGVGIDASASLVEHRLQFAAVTVDDTIHVESRCRTAAFREQPEHPRVYYSVAAD